MGDAIGKVAIIVLGRPPLLLACMITRLTLLALKTFDKVEQLTRKQRAS
jgi:hypothetical protein